MYTGGVVLLETYRIEVSSSISNPHSVQLNSALVWPALSRFLGERLWSCEALICFALSSARQSFLWVPARAFRERSQFSKDVFYQDKDTHKVMLFSLREAHVCIQTCALCHTITHEPINSGWACLKQGERHYEVFWTDCDDGRITEWCPMSLVLVLIGSMHWGSRSECVYMWIRFESCGRAEDFKNSSEDLKYKCRYHLAGVTGPVPVKSIDSLQAETLFKRFCSCVPSVTLQFRKWFN